MMNESKHNIQSVKNTKSIEVAKAAHNSQGTKNHDFVYSIDLRTNDSVRGIPNRNSRPDYGVKDDNKRTENILRGNDKAFLPRITVVQDESSLLEQNLPLLCTKTCADWEWLCPLSCSCIQKSERCDKTIHCLKEEDEKDCDKYGEDIKRFTANCEASGLHVMCPKTYKCILKQWLCDGDNDCGNHEDESNCGDIHKNCTSDQFQCQNGFCIPNSWICDAENDCGDLSDETNCKSFACTSEDFQCDDGSCVAITYQCDGDRDCYDGSDENNCEMSLRICPEGEFKCEGAGKSSAGFGGRCILNKFRCDGENDCGNWSDEEGCMKKVNNCASVEFRCDDGTCIPNRWKCDKEQDCDGGDDEKDCLETTDSFPKICTEDEYACKNGRCILNIWLCDGFSDCSANEDETDCELSCDPGQFLCSSKQNTTNLKICVPQKHICDSHEDCPNGNDEKNCPTIQNCPKNSQCEQLCITTHKGEKECACRSGFLPHPNKKSCVDIDECQFVNNPVCSQKCFNTNGSFRCGCETGYILRPDLRTCKALGGAVQLLVANRWDIRKVKLGKYQFSSLVKGLHNAIALDFHFDKGLLFWSDVSTDVIKVISLNESGANRDVVKWGLESPVGIAVDWVHNLLFWTDSGTRRVEVSDFDGKLRSVIAANDIDKPRAIAVHPGEAFVFWTDWGPNSKIERAYMDGSDRIPIINNGITWPNGLTVDFTASKIYWADAKHHVIESSNFYGFERTKVLSNNLPHPFALTMFEDTLFWTDWNTKSVSSVNKINGKHLRTVHADFHFPMDIHAYHKSRQPHFENRCTEDQRGFKGGCSHICLPNKNSRLCGCPLGLTLKEDKRTCNTTPENLIIIARKKDIRLKKMDFNSSSYEIDMIIPLDGIKSTIAIDWCSKTDFIYWADVERGSISTAHINGSFQKTVISTNIMSPVGLALDWITNKLYWTDSGSQRIEVATIDGKFRSILIWKNLTKPRDIVLSPIHGFMFWSDWGSRPSIERAYMDGKSRTKIVYTNLKWPNGIAVDAELQKIYFVDAGKNVLEYVNFDGFQRKLILRDLPHPFGLDVYKDTVFWTDWTDRSVLIADKLSGNNKRILMQNTTEIMDVQVFHRSRPYIRSDCSSKSAGCSHLCLLNPNNFSCACPVGTKLKDMKTCEEIPTTFILFAHRIDIRQISLDMDYLADVVLPLPGVTNAVAIDFDLITGKIFWSDTFEKIIMTSYMNGTGIRPVIKGSIDSVDGIAVDSVGRKLYWTDAGRHTVEVSNLDGTYRGIIAYRNLESPRGIVLNYEEGLLFWSDWGNYPKIERSNMDGSFRIKIVTANIGWPNGLTLDSLEKRVYWADANFKRIESCDYDGNKRKIVLSSLAHPYAVAVMLDDVYWTDWKSKSLQKASKLTFSQSINYTENMDGLMDIKVIKRDVVLPPNICESNNGGCSHLCLRNSRGYSCKCPTGLKMKPKGQSECEPLPEDYLLIALRSGIGMISLDSDEFLDTVLPIAGVHGAVVLDFHYNHSFLYIADVNLDVIRRVNLLHLADTKTVISENILTPNGIAVDWIANNFYWSDTDRKVIEVARLDGSSRKMIVKKYLNDPRSLIIYPKLGYLFWSDWGNPPKIERCLLDGTNRTAIVTENLGFPNGLTIDFTNEFLLWVDALQDRIEMADFNGKKREVIIPVATHPFGLTSLDSAIYWTDWYNKSVFRSTKSDGRYQNIKEIRHSLSSALDVRAISKRRQPYTWNQCANNNGGCSHICLYKGSDYVCACPDIADKRLCSTAPKFFVPARSTPYLNDKPKENYKLFNEKEESLTPSIFNVILFWSIIFTFLFIVILVVIIILITNNKKKSNRRSTGISRSSVLTFTNPNYNITDSGSTGVRTTIWKRLRYDKPQERIYKDKTITSSAALMPSSPSFTSRSSINNSVLPTIT
ncbi:low-density lipoprotein receptor-related protein 4 isoform X2 [Condylostylus longicornis]|uniref:low-density lipoprotein receptor-related protein 4 isoform X2 n=1 Tax=Condylostylus longicornis TaxID=2530218 RepID=UPI00244E0661|nr:low-density lipoprotein receptor-related protein 4 isoform X2 [Condylostylus longicornis]